MQEEDGLSVRLASSLPKYKATKHVIAFSFDTNSMKKLPRSAKKQSSFPTHDSTARHSNQYDYADVLPPLRAEIVVRRETRDSYLIVDRTATEGNSPTQF